MNSMVRIAFACIALTGCAKDDKPICDEARTGPEEPPILTATEPWEGAAVFEPSVLVNPDGTYTMFYSGVTGNHCAIGLAFSPDGVTWTKHPDNPILGQGVGGVAAACRNSVVVENGITYLYFANDPGGTHGVPLSVATSLDGVHFTVEPEPAMRPTGWMVTMANSSIWREGTTWHGLVEAYDSAGIWHIGYASGTSPLHLTLSSNAVTGLSPGGMTGGPHVEKRGEIYHLWYHASSTHNLPTDIWHATSPNLLTWVKDPSPIRSHRGYGWECDQVADPFVVRTDAGARLYYDGDNNNPPLRAAIGMMTLQP